MFHSALHFIIQTKGPPAQRRLSLGFFSNRRVSITQRLGHSAVFSRPVGPDGRPPDPNPLQPPDHRDTPPALISVFLPEFPQRTLPGPEHFKVSQQGCSTELTKQRMGNIEINVMYVFFTDPGIHSQRLIWTHPESKGLF